MGCDYYTSYYLIVRYKDGSASELTEVAESRGYFYYHNDKLPKDEKVVIYSEGKFVESHGYRYDQQEETDRILKIDGKTMADVLIITEARSSDYRY